MIRNSLNAKVTIIKICSANQLIGFYMMATLAFNEFSVFSIG